MGCVNESSFSRNGATPQRHFKYFLVSSRRSAAAGENQLRVSYCGRVT